MTAATPLPHASTLPCQANPERWFDRDHHADALAGCLGCPARRWCAREALQSQATWGLWAGIWIDGRHDDAAPHLYAVATDTPGRAAAVAAADVDERIGVRTKANTPRAPALLVRPSGWSRASSARAAVLARSSGHCEVLAKGCRYTFDQFTSRHPGRRADESCTPPSSFATCTSCFDMIACLDRKLAAGFGYLIDGGRDPAQVPFYWRASRWVLLDRDGWLTEITGEARTA